MRARAPIVGRLLFALCVVLVVGNVALSLRGSAEPPEPTAIFYLGAVVVFTAVGALIVSRRNDNLIGRLFLVIGLSVATALFVDSWARTIPPLPARDWAAWFSSWAWVAGVGTLVFVLLLFPDGRAPSPRWRIVGWVNVVAMVCLAAGQAFTPELLDFPEIRNPVGIEAFTGSPLDGGGVGWLFIMGAFVGAAASIVVRFRRSRGEERQQLKWLAFASALLAVGWLVNSFAFRPDGTTNEVFLIPFFLAMLLFPIATGVAILKHGLYDIDVVISKTLVFGVLAAFITGVYILVVVGLGILLGRGDRPSIALSIGATAIVAVAFQPVRTKAQRLANRLMYGERATPYEVMSGFSQRMAETFSIEDVLPEMAESAALGVGAQRARVRLFLPNGDERTAHWPAGTTGDRWTRSIGVSHQGRRIGEIAIEKSRDEPLTPAENRLLDDLAAQAGLALHNVRLTEELEERVAEVLEQSQALQISRQRLVGARDAQRRGLERDLHEGPESRLVAMLRELDEADALAESEPQAAGEVLDRLGEQATATLDGLRDLARGVFPPLLAEKGIVAALQAHIRKVGANATIEVDPELRSARFDPEVESCVYFCCLQSIQNVARHAANAPCVVHLSREEDGKLTFSIEDEGPGFDPTTDEPGMGLQITRDRVDALEGELTVSSSPGRGTAVRIRIPANALEAAAT